MHTDEPSPWEIAPEAVEDLIATNDPAIELVDVREDWELTRGVLPNAVHVPLSRFEAHLDCWKPDRQYVVYCEHGIRSMDVVAWLEANKGIAAKSMRGGFSVWKGPVRASSEVRKP